ncbi:hypothetical protein V491_05374 [Pseudogymnoascus sp. VKM F-3775]|nr:hypothetical protein V491_05374 [Pseudogymnoascus sp. VKM F-3775]
MSGVDTNETNPTKFWARKRELAKELFQQDDQTMEDLEQQDVWDGHESLTTISATPSDHTLSREAKSDPYRDERYEYFLASKGSFMRTSELGITDAGRSLCRTLLEEEQPVSQESLFRDDIFIKTYENLQTKNEAKVIQDIARLIVSSGETLAMLGSRHLRILVESVNQGWDNSIPISHPRPQPDYAVGFRREAFTEDQLERLQPFVGETTGTSFFMATYYMYFPFLTCEVKCSATALNVADRQNAHSMTMAVRGIVELFRLAKREKELHREILAFSVSHDDQMVRIYGHYPIIDGENTTFYRHQIHSFSFTALDGRERSTAYRFTKNVYDIWMPTHFKRMCSIIDELPSDIDFGVPQLEETATGQSVDKGKRRACRKSWGSE